MKKYLLAFTLLAALPLAASAAEGISYNYVQGGYVTTGDNNHADGWGVDGSVAIHSNVHLFGGFSDKEEGHLDLEQWRIGVGYNHQVASEVDLATGLPVVSVNVRAVDFESYPHCGIILYDHFNGCQTRKITFAEFGHVCGISRLPEHLPIRQA